MFNIIMSSPQIYSTHLPSYQMELFFTLLTMLALATDATSTDLSFSLPSFHMCVLLFSVLVTIGGYSGSNYSSTVEAFTITDVRVTGAFCSPSCKTTACNTDVPSGVHVTAKPHDQCVLDTAGNFFAPFLLVLTHRFLSGNKYCALICSPALPVMDRKVHCLMCPALSLFGHPAHPYCSSPLTPSAAPTPRASQSGKRGALIV
jgi:hypothetical protein